MHTIIKKSFFLLLISICCVGTAFGQKANKAEKMDAQAMEKVEKLNQQIIAGDASAALTAEQVETVKAAYVEMAKQIHAVKKEGGTKEEQKEQMKAIRKAANKTINKEVLTKEQRKAKKAGKE